ncbi:hypothetical protein Lal_00039977 [Lupinus albus]|nr:hypothetical protein Lal_00039977 [Lupinus albus]
MRKDPKVPMAGRGRGTSQNVQNDLLVQMVATVQQMNENLRSLNQNPAPSPSSQNRVPPGPTDYQGLNEFCKRNPSQFHRGFSPDAALEWIQGIKRIFRAMNCSEAHKSAFATYMLGTEAGNYQSSDSRLSERDSPGRVKSRAILEDSCLSERCLAWARNGIWGWLTL